ncbi:hypothetical protein CDD83_3936 [Cordyceps sp. RAO-2017]|nr:hypothetical protein CDD83_3936 [Cordyceps sp. RAO-2017]
MRSDRAASCKRITSGLAIRPSSTWLSYVRLSVRRRPGLTGPISRPGFGRTRVWLCVVPWRSAPRSLARLGTRPWAAAGTGKAPCEASEAGCPSKSNNSTAGHGHSKAGHSKAGHCTERAPEILAPTASGLLALGLPNPSPASVSAIRRV